MLVAHLPRVPETRALIDAIFTPSASMTDTALNRRRLAVTPESYEEWIEPMNEALREVFPHALNDVFALLDARECAESRLRELARVTREADLEGVPPATGAQVIGVRRFGGGVFTASDMLAVHLEAPHQVHYKPGQKMPVLRPGADVMNGDPVWVELAPAMPSNEFGHVEFFVPSDRRQEPQLGEYWTLGHPHGSSIEVGDMWTSILDATGDRLAGVRAAVFGSVDRRAAGELSANVEVTVDAVGAAEPGLAALARTADWLTLRRG